MSLFTRIKDFFTQTEHLAAKAFQSAQIQGITDDVIRTALLWIKVAERKYVDSAQQRDWVVSILVARGLSESTARCAVEMSYQLFKWELEHGYA